MNRTTAATALAVSMIIVNATPAQAHAATCRVVAMKPVVVATGVIEGSAVTRCDPGIFAPRHAWSQTTEAAVQVRAGLTNTWWPFDDPYKWLKIPYPTRVATSVRLVTRADSVVTCLGGWRVYRTLGTVDVLGPQGASVSTNASVVTRTLCGRTS